MVVAESEVSHKEFERGVRPHLDYLYALAVRLTGNRTVAEDLVQDALLRAFRGFAGLRNRERPRLWLTRVLTTAIVMETGMGHYDRAMAYGIVLLLLVALFVALLTLAQPRDDRR